MSPEPVGGGNPLEIVGETLAKLGESLPTLKIMDLYPKGSGFSRAFRERFPDRSLETGDTTARTIAQAAESAAPGSPIVVCGPSAAVAIEGLPSVRRAAARSGCSIKLVTTDGGWGGSDPPVLEDIPLARAVPGMMLVVPADIESGSDALEALVRLDGPSYLRLDPELPGRTAGGALELGRARELADGRDLTLAAVGMPVALALRAAEEMARVGVSARVLDCASLAPIDEKAILRAARDTAAILTIEGHQVATGLGSSVATLTAENYPVPVRRLGAPGLFGVGGPAGRGLEALGLTLEAVLEEAWELLRLKGKVQ